MSSLIGTRPKPTRALATAASSSWPIPGASGPIAPEIRIRPRSSTSYNVVAAGSRTSTSYAGQRSSRASRHSRGSAIPPRSRKKLASSGTIMVQPRDDASAAPT